MEAELKALQTNNTWILTTLPPGQNAMGSKWIFHIKR
ncbi:unnamed protein product [Rhodiola kirilowii]